MCGAPKQGAGLAGVDLDSQTVIQGSVWHDGAPVRPDDFILTAQIEQDRDVPVRRVLAYDYVDQIVQAGLRSYEYDNHGRVISIRSDNGGVQRLQYNGKGLLTRVKLQDGGDVEYRYDTLSRRMEKVFTGGPRDGKFRRVKRLACIGLICVSGLGIAWSAAAPEPLNPAPAQMTLDFNASEDACARPPPMVSSSPVASALGASRR